MSVTYKKLESGSPNGGLIAQSNLEEIIPTVELSDLNALVSAGYVEYDYTPQPDSKVDFTKEYVEDTQEEVATGQWRNKWKLVSRTMTTAEENSAKSRGFIELRKTRNYLLSKTDFYANSDVTMPDNVKTYRQALRDLPANTADPFNVTWPTNPVADDGLN